MESQVKETFEAKGDKACTDNIILNHDFSEGLNFWKLNGCDGYVIFGNSHPYRVNAKSGELFAVISNRTECWNGLEQDITSRVSSGCIYSVIACVTLWGSHQSPNDVKATLRLEYAESETSYVSVGRALARQECWQKLEGTFLLDNMPARVIFYLEGPSPGVELLIDSVVVSPSTTKLLPNLNQKISEDEDKNIILNPSFGDGLSNWFGRGCEIALQESLEDGKVHPQEGTVFASATKRTASWNGIQQEITNRVARKLDYEVTALVRIFGGTSDSADVRATLWVLTRDQRELYISIAKVEASDKEWVTLHDNFLLNQISLKVVIYIEGPPPGTDILLNSLVVKHARKQSAARPVIDNAAFGVNIIQNSSLRNNLNGWFPLGPCTLSVAAGSPHVLPQMARASLGPHEPLSGHYILVTNRSQNWMGPAQMITDKLKLYLTYQVSAWVCVGSIAMGPQNVNVALSVDGQWVNGGQVEISDYRWHEVGGSFRLEKQPSKVMVYVQGPSQGTDLMVAGLQIFSVDRKRRFKLLTKQTDKVRKRDVILRIKGAGDSYLSNAFVKVHQIQNSFPIGSCVNRTNIDNEDFVRFFVKNFNWAVFGNELKWAWTEPQQGTFNYRDADELLDFCRSNNIAARGHCIFWEVEYTVQPWIYALNQSDLMKAVQSRLMGLLKRYQGKFRHYDVNNEMLHGSFYQERLGKGIWAYMFKTAYMLDSSPLFFVNDYHVEDGCDAKSSPEKYIAQILELLEQGAPVGGIGIQGHIDCPVGPIVSSALDSIGILGLPIWFTELDISSTNEYVRADDLEVMLREAFAHPAVEGIMLWGFWELFMSRKHAHLVDAEGRINEAGKRFIALKHEWLSHAHGHMDAQGCFCFRGFHGLYRVDVVTRQKKISQTFVVDKGENPLVVDMNFAQ